MNLLPHVSSYLADTNKFPPWANYYLRANSSSSGQDVLLPSWNSKTHYRVPHLHRVTGGYCNTLHFALKLMSIQWRKTETEAHRLKFKSFKWKENRETLQCGKLWMQIFRICAYPAMHSTVRESCDTTQRNMQKSLPFSETSVSQLIHTYGRFFLAQSQWVNTADSAQCTCSFIWGVLFWTHQTKCLLLTQTRIF
jgi:uncharacterized iron-regulated membrane protein